MKQIADRYPDHIHSRGSPALVHCLQCLSWATSGGPIASLFEFRLNNSAGGIRSPDKTWVGEDALPPAARSPPTGAVHSFDASVGRQRDEKVVKLEKVCSFDALPYVRLS